MVRTHKDLEVWIKAVEFVTEIYRVTGCFPKQEIFGLTSQMRRASVSISSNIAEGAARKHKNEFKQFLYIALASISELDTQVIIAYNLNFIDKPAREKLIEELNTMARMLQGLIRSIST